LLNLLAKLRTVPTVADPLTRDVQSVVYADVDRIYTAAPQRFLERLTALSRGDNARFKLETGPLHPTHRKTIERALGNKAGAYTLRSFRESVGANSMQLVVAAPAPESEDRTHFAEMDIDLGNPFFDARGFVIHLGELFDPGKTNHLKLFDDFLTGPTSDFLYYRLT
jgi:hypothetical protein